MKKVVPVFILVCAIVLIIHMLKKDDSSNNNVVNIITNDSSYSSSAVSSTEGGESLMTPQTEMNDEDRKKIIEGCKILDVPYYSQDEYPTGCELVSSQMLLAYYGCDITVEDMINNNFIFMQDFYEKDGRLYGGDPNRVFVGSPYSFASYGCWSGAIIDMMYGIGVQPVDTSGYELSDLCKQYIDNETPVLVWATINMLESYKTEASMWYIEDTGELFTWISNEHCLVLVGYDDLNYYFNDPLQGKAYRYEKSLVEQRYKELGMQSIVIFAENANAYADGTEP